MISTPQRRGKPVRSHEIQSPGRCSARLTRAIKRAYTSASYLQGSGGRRKQGQEQHRGLSVRVPCLGSQPHSLPTTARRPCPHVWGALVGEQKDCLLGQCSSLQSPVQQRKGIFPATGSYEGVRPQHRKARSAGDPQSTDRGRREMRSPQRTVPWEAGCGVQPETSTRMLGSHGDSTCVDQAARIRKPDSEKDAV